MNMNVPDVTADVLDKFILQLATISALAGIGAGAIHAVVVGGHAADPLLANMFVVFAVAQLASGIALMVRPGRSIAIALVGVNAAAVVGWLVSRLVGVWFIAGLELAESPGFADTVCALLGGIALAAAAAALDADTRLGSARLWPPSISARVIALPAIAVAMLTVPAMSLAATHTHEHDSDEIHAHDAFDDGTLDEIGVTENATVQTVEPSD